jgi:hypothetical protein
MTDVWKALYCKHVGMTRISLTGRQLNGPVHRMYFCCKDAAFFPYLQRELNPDIFTQFIGWDLPNTPI